MLGYAVEELLGQQLTTLVHTDDVSTVRETLQRSSLIQVPLPTCRCRYVHRDGTWRWLTSLTPTSSLKQPSMP